MSALSRPYWGRACRQVLHLDGQGGALGHLAVGRRRARERADRDWDELVVVVGAIVVVVRGRRRRGGQCFEWPQPLTKASAAEAAKTADTRRAPGCTLISADASGWPGRWGRRDWATPSGAHPRGRTGSTTVAAGSASSGSLALPADGLGGSGDGLRVPEPAPAGLDGAEALVQLVDDRHAGRDLELGDIVPGSSVEVLDERPQAVAVGGDQDDLAGQQLRGDGVEPVREHADHDIGQALGGGDDPRHVAGVSETSNGPPGSMGGGGTS